MLEAQQKIDLDRPVNDYLLSAKLIVRSAGYVLWFSASRHITSKDIVARFGLLVAREAAFHKRRVARFAVCEVTVPPAAGCSVLL